MTKDAEFRTLGLGPDASWEDVKRAFRRLARIYHHDVAGPSGTHKFTEITEAYMSLKETVSVGFGRQARPQPASRNAVPREDAARGESIFKKFWKKLFSWEKKNSASEEDDFMSPARARFIGSVISRAESEIYGILSKKNEFVSRVRMEAVIRRLQSRHPAVVLLALRQISIYNVKDEIASAVIDHFKRSVPAPDTLERILDAFSNSPRRDDLARVMLSHIPRFSETDVLILLGRFKRWKMRPDFLRPFLSHKSSAVVAGALSCWPTEGPCERIELAGLLRKDEENILIPLLRILRKEKLPFWAGGRIEHLMKEHPSPAVRVWASAIVRDQNLS
jgi:hypothetical protein